jgi:hypothetical protein
MNQEKSKINCPWCEKEIEINNILYLQIENQIKRKYDEKFETDKKLQEENIKKQVEEKVKEKELTLKKRYKAEAEEESSDAFKALQEELNEKSGKIKEFYKVSAERETLKREKAELESSMKAELEKAVNTKLKEVEGKHELEVLELKRKLEDDGKRLEEALRMQKQKSIQIQGEAQELGIKEWLSTQFPLDTIQEMKKGERGADCLQIVHTCSRQNCGTIYYESKRTKSFQPSWIEKFKADIREKNAGVGVLVTETMPSDMERFGLREGIWVCTFGEFKGLCNVLREGIIKNSSIIATQENKGDKMSMIYNFLTSNEFKLQIEAIVEGFTQMKSDLESEQRSMRGLWKKREKQIDKVILNATNMYGSIRGIAGNAVQSVPLLELPDFPEENDY